MVRILSTTLLLFYFLSCVITPSYAQAEEPQKRGISRFFKLPKLSLKKKEKTDNTELSPIYGEQMGNPLDNTKSTDLPKQKSTLKNNTDMTENPDTPSFEGDKVSNDRLDYGKQQGISSEKNEGSYGNELRGLNEPVSTNMSIDKYRKSGSDLSTGFKINGGVGETSSSKISEVKRVPVDYRKSKEKPADFAPPNPEVEQNENALLTYSNAVRMGKLERYDEAVASLEEFIRKFPKSRLVQRSCFLIAIYAKDALNRQNAAIKLLKDYSGSRYIEELKERDSQLIDTAEAALGVKRTPHPSGEKDVLTSMSVSNQTNLMTQLEAEANSNPTMSNRFALAEEYLKRKSFQRAESLLESMLNDVQGTQSEPRCLDLLSQCQIALGQLDDARVNMDNILRFWPKYEKTGKVRLNMAVLSEDVGNLDRAKIEYNRVLKEHEGTEDAAIAKKKLSNISSKKKTN